MRKGEVRGEEHHSIEKKKRGEKEFTRRLKEKKRDYA